MNITLIAGDICSFNGDVIVNPANNKGLGGGGADGAIHKAAGPGLREACKLLPIIHKEGYGPGLEPVTSIRVPNGGAVPTPAFNLPCHWVIHTAGPVWPTDPDAALYFANNPASSLAGMQMKFGVTEVRAEDLARQTLRECYKMPALVALGMGCKSIAYPAISAGVYGCPVETCAEVALGWAKDYADWPLDVTFYLHPAANLPVWAAVAKRLGIEVKVGWQEGSKAPAGE